MIHLRNWRFYLVSILLISSAGRAFALPLAPIDSLEFTSKLFLDLEQNYDFEGIVKLSNCSGSLVKFEGQPDSDKALMLTNGHCLEGGFLKSGEFVVNKPSNRSFSLFKKNEIPRPQLFPIKASMILYGTMTDTDVALYQLTETYTQILDRTKVRPLTINNQQPEPGTEIEIISGYWNRGYSCAIDGIVYRLREADWTWKNSIRYTEGCNTIGGTSGSPILAKGTTTVIGINNTSNESGERCTINNPCEVNEAGEVTFEKELRYGQNVHWFYSCLNNKFEIDLKKEGCELPR